jgi:hypothetical protein
VDFEDILSCLQIWRKWKRFLRRATYNFHHSTVSSIRKKRSI